MIDNFLINNQDLKLLSPEEAIEVFGDLLYAEAIKLEIPLSKIRIPANINVADGGIDAAVDVSRISIKEDLIKNGITRYQIKASEAFKPTQKNVLKKELFGNKRISRDNLDIEVKKCLDAYGTYILVCFRQDLVEKQYQSAITELKKLFIKCGYEEPKCEIWSQTHLKFFIKPYLGLALKIKKLEKLNFLSYDEWAGQAEMRKAFKKGQVQSEVISSLQDSLLNNVQAEHIHVTGEPGIGKTRLVLEALRVESLAPFVIYCDTPDKAKNELLNYLIRNQESQVILVVDECDSNNRTYLWDNLKNQGKRIRLVTIYYEPADFSGKILYTAALNLQEIGEIIQEYDVPESEAQTRWAPYCGGSPRTAHVIGFNLQNHPDDILKSPDTVPIWDRFIADRESMGSLEAKNRKKVLQYIALFKKFGYGTTVKSEAEAIYKLIEKRTNGQISPDDFHATIKKLKDLKILQGKDTLYITPKALHIKLWSEWWDTFGNNFNLNDFYESIPETLKTWFDEMLIYAKESNMAQRLVKQLLGPEGPFQTSDLIKTQRGASFFRYLTEADPGAAVNCLKVTIGTWSNVERLNFVQGRREIIWALEKIIIWREHFQAGAELLLALGEAENEIWGNNASGTFAKIFTLGWGSLASTQAPPDERFPILAEAIFSDSKARRQLALKAIGRALETRHFSRDIGSEYQGLRTVRDLWTPTTYSELFQAYKQLWELLRSRLDSLPADEQREAVDILLIHAPGIGSIVDLTDMILETLQELAQKPYIGKNEVLDVVTKTLFFETTNLDEGKIKKWELFKEELTSSDFPSLLRRYIGKSLLQDSYENGHYVDRSEAKIKELVGRVILEPTLLNSELIWLAQSEEYKSAIFGYELGKKFGGEFIDEILKKHIEINKIQQFYFLGGYLRAIFERSVSEWEQIIAYINKDTILNHSLAEIVARSGMTDKVALLLLELAKNNVISPLTFDNLRYGSIQKLPQAIFHSWIEFLLSYSDFFIVHTALLLFSIYYDNPEKREYLPRELSLRLLTHPSLFSEETHRVLDTYLWSTLGENLITLFPDLELQLAQYILEQISTKGNIFGKFSNDIQGLFNKIALHNPREVWKLITIYLGPPLDSRAFTLREWLKESGFLRSFEEKAGYTQLPLEDLWEWIDVDIENRAWYAATFLPKDFADPQNPGYITREFLTRYGNQEDVRGNLMGNYVTEFWKGPRSLHYQNRKAVFEGRLKEEKNINVKKWIKEYIEWLNRQIDDAEIEEERRF